MKKLYRRHLEVSIDGGNSWEFAAFFKNDYCYIEEVPDLQKVEKGNTYDEVLELAKSWQLMYKEKKSILTKKRYLIIKLPFTSFIVYDNGKQEDFQVRVKYEDKSNASMRDLMDYLSNQDFREWASDNKLKYFEKRG